MVRSYMLYRPFFLLYDNLRRFYCTDTQGSQLTRSSLVDSYRIVVCAINCVHLAGGMGSFLSESFFFPNFRRLFRAIFQSSIFSCFVFPNVGVKFNELDFLLLENFTNSDRTPPFIDTYLQLFPNFGSYGRNEQTLSDKNEPYLVGGPRAYY